MSVARAAVVAASVAVFGGELLCREGDSTEHLAGILGAAATGGITAFLGGDGVIQHRNYQLGIPLQPNDGELAQGDEEPPLPARKHQLLIKDRADALGDLGSHGIAGTFAHIPDFGTQHHGIQHLHNGGRPVGSAQGAPIRVAQRGIAAEDMGTAVFPAENGTLAEYSQSIEGCGAAGTHYRVRQHPVVEGNVNAVVIAVKGNGCDIDFLRYENQCNNSRHYLGRYHRLQRYHC